ncbi:MULTISPECIES: NAD-dependent epimerase/dehydratase family protein [Bacillus]|jgi:UDP-glucose 4-epimerase|uniref:NAD-dependent epimerase/dehydratase family protein n=1 Tax=Bacillus TaxID=1386 RepID=UPI00065E5BF1|nr:NAD-dependent epimerase/dehydratase family protein [Bacillus smithii]AKP46214.1 UDP-glucose 4-epimerase [Bacillus smithii]MED1421085.1 GDP-mannose 4,6-dehydratase [Bacillus smithii]MED1456958.1 GDP-mannose 4,6-dehydratase [Bacillus smithii]MED1488611.1 GDP-mannose 4,6-dehydratase [Bacillus smithii]MED4884380.1 GDP-mannose 4,6-dehydratase [Bacillus smithii]
MKAVVTGGAGFIGSHLVEELLLQGAKVHVLDNLVSGQLKNVHPLAVMHIEDIRSQGAKQIIKREKPDVVFHLAAQADVGQSIREPKYDADMNINGTINILEACREASVKKIIFASTSGVYGNLQKDLISEKDLTMPISYYGLSKLTAESYIRLFHQLYGLSYTILRFGNVYGPRQSAKGEGGVIAIFLDRIKKGMPLMIHGDGEQTRDFVYVKDVVRANIAAVEKGDQETIQVSTGRSVSVNHLVKMLTQIYGSPIETIYTHARTGDIKHSCLDNKKARQLLQWNPQVDIFNGLTETYTFS